MNNTLFIFFGIVPSLIWLVFYLRQDDHPEPKQMILKVFFWGMLSTIPALAIELLFKKVAPLLPFSSQTTLILFVFLGIALVEELCKFLVVRWKVYSNKAMDEPVDLMMYMIVSALGFSALENIFVLFNLGQGAPFDQIATLSFIRLLGATFLHALSSGIFGYFLALSFFAPKKRGQYACTGLALAALLHGLFNIVIIEATGAIRFWGPLVIFILTILFISFAIAKLKHMKSVCNI